MSGKLRVSPGAVGGVAYDPEVERERLAFEQRKWEAEMEERRQTSPFLYFFLVKEKRKK